MSNPQRPDPTLVREKAAVRLRALTRGAILAAAGATAAIGIVVAHDHSGSGTTSDTGGSTGAATGSSGSVNSGTNSKAGDNSSSSSSSSSSDGGGISFGGSTAPSSTSSRPAVTSGGTS